MVINKIENEEKIKSPLEVWRDVKITGVEFITIFSICSLIFWFGKLEEDKCGLFYANFPVDVVTMLLAIIFPAVLIISYGQKKSDDFIYCIQIMFGFLILALQKYYPDEILIEWGMVFVVGILIYMKRTKRMSVMLIFTVAFWAIVVWIFCRWNLEARVQPDYWRIHLEMVISICTGFVLGCLVSIKKRNDKKNYN